MEKINFKNSLIKEPNLISICACDAGAAEHIYAWTKNINSRFNYCLNGPALKIFQKHDEKLVNLSIEECLEGSDIHIAGTAWSSDLEIHSTKLAKEKSIYTISVLDHWVSYKERFFYKDKLILPDEIWVSDKVAKEIASSLFPTVKISQLPNFWMDDLKVKVRDFSNEFEKYDNNSELNLLYLLEPIRESKQWETKKNELSEFDALRYFFDNLNSLKNFNFNSKYEKKLNLRFRLHPSEKKEKYNSFLVEFKSLVNYSISSSKNLEEDLAWCDIAFGIETQALICAIECDITAISTKPLWAGKCCLPHKKLLHLSNLK